MKFVIVGGGTAGWLTALYIKTKFPEDKVTVVASSEMGILGAGEGTTVQFMEYLAEVGLSKQDIIDNCRGTEKRSIKFVNWNGDGDEYFHYFVNGGEAMHFDASLLAKYLQTVALSRGVVLIDDKVDGFQVDDDGNILSLHLEPDYFVSGDFFFDCSGFRKLIVGGFYKEPWIDYQMPCKRAIPFFLPNDGKNLPDYTESIAMKNGWVWKIPVNGRYGCGYVYDSNLTTDEEAKKEVEELLGFMPEFPNLFNFKPGCLKRSWVNNCVAIGLSSNFIEPLEATSIWVQIMALRMFVSVFGQEDAREKFNFDLECMNEDILCFIYLHYMSERKDTEFWKNFQESNKIPEKLEHRLLLEDEYRSKESLWGYDFNLFSEQSWKAILEGIRMQTPK